VLAGARTKLQVAHFKLSHSRAFYVLAYLLQTHEMLFDAHNHAFSVPKKLSTTALSKQFPLRDMLCVTALTPSRCRYCFVCYCQPDRNARPGGHPGGA